MARLALLVRPVQPGGQESQAGRKEIQYYHLVLSGGSYYKKREFKLVIVNNHRVVKQSGLISERPTSPCGVSLCVIA